MKQRVRLYVVIALAFSSILFSAWRLSWVHQKDILSSITEISDFLGPITGLDLVVFGDAWSDSSVYRTSTNTGHPKITSQFSHKSWSEHLCQEINCRHRNYAGLRPKTIPGIGHAGAPVANGLHLHGQFIQFQDEEQTADLRAQMKEWKKHNDIAKEGVAKGESDAPSNRTIFVLDFGLWDIWQAVALDPENARYIVTTSVDMIFEALDVLDQIKGEDRPASDGTKAILPLVLDMTFLPGFAKDGETTKTTLELIQLWNGLLTERAKNWSKGDLFLYDTNAFLVEHIRARQIVSVDRLEEGRQDEIKAAFANVNGSCIGSLNGTTHNDKHQEACDTPDDFLFWDEVHFTPKAHQLIAQEIKRDIETLSSGWV